VDDHRHVAAGVGQRVLGTQGGRPGLQQVLGGLDQHRVDVPAEQPLDLSLVGIAQRSEADVTQRRQLGTGPHAAQHETRPISRLMGIGGVPGDPGTGGGELEDPVGDPVLPQRGQVGSERVGFDRVHARREVRVVDRPNHIGPGEVQDLVAAFQTIEVGQRQVIALQHGAHRPVRDHHTVGQHGSKINRHLPRIVPMAPGWRRITTMWRNRGRASARDRR
jgi:hypothetical protein